VAAPSAADRLTVLSILRYTSPTRRTMVTIRTGACPEALHPPVDAVSVS